MFTNCVPGGGDICRWRIGLDLLQLSKKLVVDFSLASYLTIMITWPWRHSYVTTLWPDGAG